MQSRNFGLDTVRAVAISLVLLCHFAKPTKILGVLGVEMFFALSGFLIGGIFLRELYRNQQFGLKELYGFLRRRWYRTLPNYFLFLGIFILIWPIIGRSIPYQLWKYPLFLQNFAWEIPGFFLYSWSLAIEEWFYLLFPISVVLLLTVTKSKNKSLIISITLMTLVPAVARFARSPVLDWGGGLQMIVICRLDALMYGVLVAWLKFKRPLVFKRMTKWALPAMLGAAALTVTAHRFYSLTSPSEMPAIVFTLLPMACALMLPGAYYLAPFGRFLPQPITNLSLWSYSIYLSHPAILYLAYHFTDPYVHGAAGKLLVKAACLAATLLISKIIFEYFETPIMNLRDRRRTVKPAAMAEQKAFGAQSGRAPTTAEASLSVED